MNTAISESTSLALAPRHQFDLSPQTFEQALTFAGYLAESEMVPKQFRGRPGDCLIAMQWGYEVNFKPLQALQSIAVINGKPGIYGDAGKAILLAAGCIIDEDDTEVVKRTGRGRCKITRPGKPPCERTFSVDDAKAAKLWEKEGPWRTYPHRQMAWRAFWFAARDCAADLLRGMGGAEEAIDVGTVTAEVVANPPSRAESLAPYSEVDFERNLPVWRSLIDNGKKSADDIIAMVATKGTLTEAQRAAIRGTNAQAKTDAVDAEFEPKGDAA
jgi:hypothetical protein